MRSKMPGKTAFGRTIIWTLLVTSLIDKVTCNGVFELRLTSFFNEQGINSEGHCCGGIKKDRKCTQTCRTMFYVCLKQYQAKISLKSPCTFGSFTTPVLGENSFGINTNNNLTTGFENPIKFSFQFSWPGTFTLIIEAYHSSNDSLSPRDGKSGQLILRSATQTSVPVGQQWSMFNHTDPSQTNGSRLEYAYRVVCAEHYYGDSCETKCVPRRDKFGYYKCDKSGRRICLPGWQGQYCDKAICLPGCNPRNGYCEQPNECRCRHGWHGENCNQCLPYPGCDHGSCKVPWECTCDEGWGGIMCDLDLNYCTRNRPCKNGATCLNTGRGSFTCSCRPGFSGTTCEIKNDRDKDDCASSPCLNEGTCVDIGRTFQCICKEGFHGRNCESNATSCSEIPCKNRGTCIDRFETYLCECAPGYTGVDCEMEADECQPNPCINGDCIDEFNGYRCVCPVGYSGKHCAQNENNCLDKPCRNNGTCVDSLNDFKCSCPAGFTGKRCQVNVNECRHVTCSNRGKCLDLINGYRCVCDAGFYGKNCDLNVDRCASRPCKNGGICETKRDGFICKCVNGFGGSECHLGNTSLDFMRALDSTEEGLPLQQVVIIICLGAGIPITVIIIVVIIFLCRRRRTMTSSEDDAAAKRENEQNHQKTKSLNNKCVDSDVTIPSSRNICIKLTNEMQNCKEFIIEKPNNDKHLIRNDLQTVDERVQRKELQIQHRHLLNRMDLDYSNTSKLSSSSSSSGRSHVQSSSFKIDSNHKRLSSHRRSRPDSDECSEIYPAELMVSKPVTRSGSSSSSSSSNSRGGAGDSTSVYSLHTHHPYRDSIILATEV
ncbi:uncharacterized protein LOC141905386 [Tubulanus polymorphus]|uniref:uncharacterized protein LOC141905386 n=1 Tax=Tubulanus polymorphus TaxID=672921 RepID=UPI003DA23078